LISIFMPLIIVPFISANRWQSFLRVVGIKENIFILWYINWLSMFQGIMLPSTQGSDVLRIYHIEQRYPQKQGVAGSTVLIERMIGVVLLCLLSLAALPFVMQGWKPFPLFLTVFGINIAVFLILGLILSKRLHGFYTKHKFEHKTIARIFEYIDKFHGAIVYFPYRKVVPFSILWIVGFQLAIVFTIYLVFCAYGYDVTLIQHMAIFPMIAVLSIVPITIGGFGVREGFFAYFYSLIGVPPAISVGVSIVQYIILILLPASLGGLLFLWRTLLSRTTVYSK